MPTIARLYDRYEDARRTVGDLESIGIPAEDISIVANQDGAPITSASDDPDETPVSKDAAIGEEIGAAIGGGAGLLAGLGLLAIPGIGPVVAAGWLVATITGAGVGAAAGSLLGALVGAGVSNENAHQYVEGVKHGGALVTVRVGDDRAAAVEQIMNIYNPADPAKR